MKAFHLNFSAVSQKANLERVLALAPGPHASSVLLTNAHVVVETHRDPQLLATLQNATLIVPDGVPVAWVLKAKGAEKTERYSGPDLMLDVFDKVPHAKHFFLGSTPEILEKIKTKFEGVAVGFYSPPFSKDFSDEEMQKQINMVDNSNADFVWVGLGAPKQEKYVVQMAGKARKGVWLAVGAAFDFYAGTKPRAPKILQKLGLEWAFRMISEPTRLVPRYLSTNPQFIRLAILELSKTANK